MANGPSRLPFPLAWVRADVETFILRDGAGSSVLCLHHLIDAVEVSARFLVAVAAAESEDPARRRLGERPALGTWLSVLEALVKRRDGTKDPLPVRPAALALLKLSNSKAWAPQGAAWANLVGLRNWIAHGGLPEPLANAILEDALPAFMTTMDEIGEAFEGAILAYVAADGTCSGQGPGEGRPDLSGLEERGPGVFIGRDGEWIEVWPVVRYGPPGPFLTRPVGGDADRMVHQIFLRIQAGSAQYVTLDDDSVIGLGGRDEAQAYSDRFTEVAEGFWPEVEAVAARFVGRTAEMEAVLASITDGRAESDEASGAALRWLYGSMGKGKSAISAKAATILRDLPADQVGPPVVIHLFKAGDSRCGLAAFVQLALRALAPLEDETPFDSTDTRRARAALRRRLAAYRPTVICDGVDQLGSSGVGEKTQLIDLVDLAGSGGVWLLSGRDVPDVRSALGGATAVFAGSGLPDMQPSDLRTMFITQAPPAVRDAVLLRDAAVTRLDDPVTNPYIESLVAKASGSPQYLTLMLDWLTGLKTPAAIKGKIAEAVANPAVLPTGLAELYGLLFDDWGLGTLAEKKTPLLCLIAQTREPLDVPALAELVWPSSSLKAREQGRLDLCRQIVGVFAPVLRLEADFDGILGHRVDHDSFREFLATDDRTELSFEDGGQVLAERSRRPGDCRDEQLRRHLFHWGITYLIAAGGAEQAAPLLTDFGYLYERLSCLGTSGMHGLLSDYWAVSEAEGSLDHDAFSEWAAFIKQNLDRLARADDTWPVWRVFHQLAWDHASSSSVTREARRWSGSHHLPPIRVADQWRRESAETRLVMTAPHPGLVEDAFFVGADGVLSWGDRTINVWDVPSGGIELARATFDEGIASVIRLEGAGRIVVCTGDGGLRVFDLRSSSTVADARFAIDEPISVADRWSRTLRVPHSDSVILTSPDHVIRPLSARGVGDRLAGHRDRVNGGVTLRDGRLASWSDDGTLRVWDLETAGQSWVGYHQDWVTGALELDTGDLLSWSRDGTLSVWSESGELHAVVRIGDGHVLGAVDCGDGIVMAWTHRGAVWLDGRGGQLLERREDPELDSVPGLVGGACASAGLVAFWRPGGDVAVIDSRARRLVGSLSGQDSDMSDSVWMDMAWLDGRVVISGSLASHVVVWDPVSGDCQRLLGHTASLRGTARGPGQQVLSWALDNTLRLWDLDRPLGQSAADADVEGVAAAGPTEFLAWSRRSLYVCDVTTGVRSWEAQSDDAVAGAVALGPHRFASWSRDGGLTVWDRTVGSKVVEVPASTARIERALPIDEARIATTCWDGRLRVWDLVRSEVVTLLGRVAAHSALAFTGGRILTVSEVVTIWDPGLGATALVTAAGASGLWSGGLTVLDQDRVAVWWTSGQVAVWNLTTGLEECSFLAEGLSALAAVGPEVLVAVFPRGVRTWSTRDGSELAHIPGPAGRYARLLPIDDGALISWSRGGTVCLWNLADRSLQGCAVVDVDVSLPGWPTAEPVLLGDSTVVFCNNQRRLVVLELGGLGDP